MKKYISIILVLINILMILTLCSCETYTPPNQYTLVYMASDGGKVTGEQIQIVDEGDNAETVIAVPYDGYEFAGWSDDIVTAERTDISVKNDIDVTAYFKIKTE
ncbi:MAG: hypothetical protein NC131_11180 [Roseburia sp.]|nr:hypothetical protein [Roseburia sp.]